MWRQHRAAAMLLTCVLTDGSQHPSRFADRQYSRQGLTSSGEGPWYRNAPLDSSPSTMRL